METTLNRKKPTKVFDFQRLSMEELNFSSFVTSPATLEGFIQAFKKRQVLRKPLIR